ncbi:conserved hypothetical protein [Brucella sp. 83/13]|nr:conserved hypothetical protein [Brucella sp. 83/13]
MEYEDEMPLLIVQLAILIAVAFVVGCFLGRILRRRKSAGSDHERTIVAAALSTPPLAEKPEPVPPAEPVRADSDPLKAKAGLEKARIEPVEASADSDVAAAPVLQEALPETPEDADRPQWREAPRRGKADELTAIEGIGKAIEAVLHELGIFHYDQIAQWTREEAIWIERRIGFPGRVEREGWIAQAAKLAEPPVKSTTKRAAKPKKAANNMRSGTRRAKKQAG